jgi:hypothetical protein
MSRRDCAFSRLPRLISPLSRPISPPARSFRAARPAPRLGAFIPLFLRSAPRLGASISRLEQFLPRLPRPAPSKRRSARPIAQPVNPLKIKNFSALAPPKSPSVAQRAVRRRTTPSIYRGVLRVALRRPELVEGSLPAVSLSNRRRAHTAHAPPRSTRACSLTSEYPRQARSDQTCSASPSPPKPRQISKRTQLATATNRRPAPEFVEGARFRPDLGPKRGWFGTTLVPQRYHFFPPEGPRESP